MASKTVVAKSLEDLPSAAAKILSDLEGHTVFALRGPMGAGKTTLIKAFCDLLGVREVVSSPTFALVNEYTDEAGEPVFHFDFYRIKKIEEVFDIGYEEYFYSDYRCFIEWPELVESLLPEFFVEVNIRVGENEERIISYQANQSS
jgi:tRNA threonylcarbamoyladenosine biosynthesis protein TsaE